MSFLSKYLEGYPEALPEHLQVKLHSDWFGPLKKIPRSWNARGPRCGKGSPGYMPWPPRLVEGEGIARWENNFSTSIIEIPALAKAVVTADQVYEKEWRCIERNPGHADFGKTFTVILQHREMSWSEIRDGQMAYSPSALQKYSTHGWMKLEPSYYSCWNILKQREIPGIESGEDIVLFFRKGARPDHLDLYYNLNKILPVGMAGLHWE